MSSSGDRTISLHFTTPATSKEICFQKLPIVLNVLIVQLLVISMQTENVSQSEWENISQTKQNIRKQC